MHISGIGMSPSSKKDLIRSRFHVAQDSSLLYWMDGLDILTLWFWIFKSIEKCLLFVPLPFKMCRLIGSREYYLRDFVGRRGEVMTWQKNFKKRSAISLSCPGIVVGWQHITGKRRVVEHIESEKPDPSMPKRQKPQILTSQVCSK